MFRSVQESIEAEYIQCWSARPNILRLGRPDRHPKCCWLDSLAFWGLLPPHSDLRGYAGPPTRSGSDSRSSSTVDTGG